MSQKSKEDLFVTIRNTLLDIERAANQVETRMEQIKADKAAIWEKLKQIQET